jgi:sterol 24-C-methyltransferase
MLHQDIPFPSNRFDAVYAIGATVHAPSLVSVYSEIYRIPNPGAVFSVFKDTFYPTDFEHGAIRPGIEGGNGTPALQTKINAQEAMKKSWIKVDCN